MSSLKKYVYSDLTWPEVNEAVLARKVVLLPVGSTEQHGPHLPLDVDNFLPTSVCLEAGKRRPEDILVMPTVPYGYNEHAQDFPGTIHVHYDHFIEYCLDVVKSVAYFGFGRILIVDGHGSNEHLCEFAARRGTLETSALVASTMWTNFVVEKFEEVRESGFGGSSHACELETSVYLYLDPSKVQMDKAADQLGGADRAGAGKFLAVDLTRGYGPVRLMRWASSGSPTGVFGAPTKATPEKGRAIFEAAVSALLEFVAEFKAMPTRERVDHRAVRPELPRLPSPD
jgi:creatinine amidohydrolase